MIVYDCTNKYILPGFIDGYTHFDLNVSQTKTIDDFKSGSIAAISGGTTTIIDYATQYKNESLKNALNNWIKKTKKGVSLNEIKSIIRYGISILNYIQHMI